jgi:hypothetical protein
MQAYYASVTGGQIRDLPPSGRHHHGAVDADGNHRREDRGIGDEELAYAFDFAIGTITR